ncbi:PREDICTED: nucleoside diphosphate kinase 3 [Bison bison bison]|uniref:Nucleoside diphosphate kinase n=1 Tax=Bison bison bison TaxID=43346 RepID=A0A6P3ICT6_BISBB|nr:PREDICTED: nucleoside diphosphate kinase 3 [Bison bison bison]
MWLLLSLGLRDQSGLVAGLQGGTGCHCCLRPLVWQGLDVVRASRALIGATNPADATPGTIRGDFCIEVGKNVIHGSDSVESARREIALWFRTDELLCWEDSAGHWLYE